MKNIGICIVYFDSSQFVIKEFMVSYIDVRLSDVIPLRKTISFLIVTATDIETNELHSRLNRTGKDDIIRVYKDKQAYYLGFFGNFFIVHVQSEMGAIGRQSSIITTINAIDLWNPRAVLMPGIAFGIDSNKQKIGDILISESLAPYNFQKISSKKIIYRSPIPPAGDLLLNRFKHSSKSWNYEGNESPKIYFTCMLSGESLIDNIEYRDELISAFPTSDGGEMEGAGIYAAASSRNLEWLVVKSICDFADGNKSDGKKEKQLLAIKTSISLCEYVLSLESSFEDLKCVEFKPENQKIELPKPSVPDLRDVIFDIYYAKYESFYITRSIDSDFQSVVGLYSVWLYGDSGNGKTSIIRRFLEIGDIRSIYITLGSCHEFSSIEILNYILYELYEKSNSNIVEIPSFPAPIVSKKIYEAIKSLLGEHNNLVLYIDEIPLSDDGEFRSFIRSITSVLQFSKLQNDNIHFKIILSSIRGESTGNIGAGINNVSENIKFIKVEKWSTKEIEELFDMIVSELGISGASQFRDKVISASLGSPRFIKNFLKYHLAKSSSSIDSLVDLTRREMGW